jgi:hypothetical protein
MMTRHVATIAVLLAAAAAIPLGAQKITQVHPGKGGSPHVRSEWVVRGANISIEFGRPSLKGRPESELMPPGQPWRTGADEATTLKTDKRLMLGELEVPAGTYTLYTVPGPRWELIVSKATGQWGIPYPEGQDLGRVAMLTTRIPPVEQLTITMDDTPGGGRLRIEWGTARASVPVVVLE